MVAFRTDYSFSLNPLWLVVLFLLCQPLAISDELLKFNSLYENKHTSALALKRFFRVDAFTEETILLVERKFGSQPIILVTPSGKKWLSNRHPDRVRWVTGATGDIICIPEPEVGPYQIIGQFVAGSKILTASDLQLVAEAPPAQVYQGERLKLSAKLIGGEQLVRVPGLDYILTWQANLILKKTENNQDVGYGRYPLSPYVDNGSGADNKPDDGIFTASIELEQEPASYELVVSATNEMLHREIRLPFLLLPPPITIDFQQARLASPNPTRMIIKVDETQLEPSKTHLQFKFTLAGQEALEIAVDKLEQGINSIAIPELTKFGIYQVNGTLASTTLSGREIILSLFETSFEVAAPKASDIDERLAIAQEAQVNAINAKKLERKYIFWSLIINLSVLILSLGIYVLWRIVYLNRKNRITN